LGKKLKELSKKAHTHIKNVILLMGYVPEQWKRAQVPQTRKPPDNVKTYRPISLFPSLSKLLEKLLFKRLKPIIEEKIFYQKTSLDFATNIQKSIKYIELLMLLVNLFKEKILFWSIPCSS